jgi:hypothetical protein
MPCRTSAASADQPVRTESRIVRAIVGSGPRPITTSTALWCAETRMVMTGSSADDSNNVPTETFCAVADDVAVVGRIQTPSVGEPISAEPGQLRARNTAPSVTPGCVNVDPPPHPGPVELGPSVRVCHSAGTFTVIPSNSIVFQPLGGGDPPPAANTATRAATVNVFTTAWRCGPEAVRLTCKSGTSYPIVRASFTDSTTRRPLTSVT